MDITVSSSFLDKETSFFLSINTELYTLHMTNLMLIKVHLFRAELGLLFTRFITREVQR